jgi:predicted metal-dependent hydrolase
VNSNIIFCIAQVKIISQLPFSYQIRRSQRAKKARIIVSPAKVEVVVPLRMAERHVYSFIYNNRIWVTKTLDKMAARQQQVENLAPVKFLNGVEIPYRGEKYKLSVSPYKLKRIKIIFRDEFNVLIPAALFATDYSPAVRTALFRWFKQQAKEKAECLVQHHAVRYQLVPRSIIIKTQKSRWGSCGIHNDINLNWLLILAPPDVFEYVVVHELCHIRHRNHSADFWALVGKHLPGFPQQRAWLKANGASLMAGL